MKTVLCYALLLLAPLMALSQPAIPEYGKIDKADLMMADCDFDAGAVAFKLLDYGKVRFAKSKYIDEKDLTGQNGSVQGKLLKVVTERRVRIKILKTEGIDLANIKIPFFTKEEAIKKTAACTYNIDGSGNVSVSEVGKDGIYVKKITQTNSQLVMVLPNVKVGSVIEYKYTLETENEYFVRDWYFQSVGMPTRMSYYDINIPLTHGFGEEAFINHPSAVKNSKELKETFGEGGAQVEVPFVNRIFYLQNVHSIKREPFAGAIWDYMQRVYYHSVGNARAKNKDPMAPWRGMANMLSDKGGYDESAVADIKGSEALVQKASQQQDTAQKIKVIFDYLRNNITCTEDEDVFPNEGAAAVWQKRTGSIADINLLLVNLLQKAGVNALVLMGSTYDNGVVSLNYPSYKQFNVLLACVPTANGYYVLNAADNTSLAGLTPWYMLGTKGLVVNGDESVFVDITDNGQDFKQAVDVDIFMDSRGKATGKAMVKSHGYAKAPRIDTWLHDKEKFASKHLASPQFSFAIDSLRVSNEAEDTLPLEQRFNFDLNVNSSGAYHYIPTNLFTGLIKNPFIDDERRTDVEFRYYQAYYLNVNITLPDGFAFEELPPSTQLAMPNKSIECSRTISVTGNKMALQMTLMFNQWEFSAKDYGFLKEFYKKLFNLLEEPVVVKKR
jgi:Domain of Unknown Function with PDB structure (DUF3857)/Transglutaminase-like superfamily